MEIFFIVFAFMAVLITLMAIGVIFNNKPISGSCGGMSALGMDVACDICKGDPAKCDKESAEASKGDTELAYEAETKV
jgi:hypothetical protein